MKFIGNQLGHKYIPLGLVAEIFIEHRADSYAIKVKIKGTKDKVTMGTYRRLENAEKALALLMVDIELEGNHNVKVMTEDDVKQFVRHESGHDDERDRLIRDIEKLRDIGCSVTGIAALLNIQEVEVRELCQS